MSEKALLQLSDAVVKWLAHLMEVRILPKRIQKSVANCSKQRAIRPKAAQELARKLGIAFVDLLGESAPQFPELPATDFRKGVSFSWNDKNATNLYALIGLLSTKQAWLSSIREEEDEDPCPLVLPRSPHSIPDEETITHHLRHHFDIGENAPCTFTFSEWVQKCESLGVIVICTNCVGVNTKQKLDPDYIRGLTLADRWAPLIFVNSDDSETARRFTLCHELVHVALSESAISDPNVIGPGHPRESLCNKIAAELLMPRSHLSKADIDLPQSDDQDAWFQAIEFLARKYRVSPLAMTIRLYTLNKVSPGIAETLIAKFRSRRKAKSSGVRRSLQSILYQCNGQTLTNAVVMRLRNGEITLREAKNVLGVSYKTLVKFLEKLHGQRPGMNTSEQL
ncbi:MAG: ImmA/IrrE family metallo-endopeptidase [Synergistales bacterium]|nr:ImmA/IrrE family metallo-endopeptidase [Synergistales bacterium]